MTEICYCGCDFKKHNTTGLFCIKKNCRCKGYRTVDQAVKGGLATIPPKPLSFDDIFSNDMFGKEK